MLPRHETTLAVARSFLPTNVPVILQLMYPHHDLSWSNRSSYLWTHEKNIIAPETEAVPVYNICLFFT